MMHCAADAMHGADDMMAGIMNALTGGAPTGGDSIPENSVEIGSVADAFL